MDEHPWDLRNLTWWGWLLTVLASASAFCGLLVVLSAADDWLDALSREGWLVKRIFLAVLLGLGILPGVIVFCVGSWILSRIGLTVWKPAKLSAEERQASTKLWAAKADVDPLVKRTQEQKSGKQGNIVDDS
jgi:hypothetical protein